MTEQLEVMELFLITSEDAQNFADNIDNDVILTEKEMKEVQHRLENISPYVNDRLANIVWDVVRERAQHEGTGVEIE